ncbi:F-box domain-containing protein [Colletotrichum asianum]
MANVDLLTLPAELVNKISEDLSSDDLLALQLACRRMRDMTLSNLITISHNPTLSRAVQAVELCINHLIQPQHYINRWNDQVGFFQQNLHIGLLVEALSNLQNCRRVGLGDYGAFQLGSQIRTLLNQFVSNLLPNSLIYAIVSIRTLLYAIIKSRLPVEHISIKFGDLIAGCICVILKMLLLLRNLERAVSS